MSPRHRNIAEIILETDIVVVHHVLVARPVAYAKIGILHRAVGIGHGTFVVVVNTALTHVFKHHGNQGGCRGVHPKSFGGVLNGAALNADARVVEIHVLVLRVLEGAPHHTGLVGAFANEIGCGLFHHAVAQRGGGAVVAAVAEAETRPAAHLVVQRSEGNGGACGAHGIEHTTLVAVAAHIKAVACLHLEGDTGPQGKLRCAAIDFHVAQQGVAVGIVVPSLVRTDLPACHGNVGCIVGESHLIAVEGERSVGSAGIHAVFVARASHAVEGGIEIGSLVADAIVCVARNGGVIECRSRVVEPHAAIVVAQGTGRASGRGTKQVEASARVLREVAIRDGGA